MYVTVKVKHSRPFTGFTLSNVLQVNSEKYATFKVFAILFHLSAVRSPHTLNRR